MSLRALLASALLLVVGGCSVARALNRDVRCESDDQCEGGQLCFAEGCGDPGSGIVVEVSSGSLTTHYPRDFAITNGTLTKAQDFDLGVPLSISGEFQRERAAIPNPADRTSYVDPVTVRAVGRSLLLPGVTRSFETRFERPERGYFEMKLAAGEYQLTAFAADRTVPPVMSPNPVQPGSPPTPVSFAFPAADGAPALTGQLIKTTDATLLPPEPVLLSASFPNGEVPVVELQLLDVATNQPLSQRFPVSGSTGEFSLTVSPEARNKSALILVAAPRDPGVPIPTKRFMISTPLPPAISLEYGDFGDAADVTGSIVDSAGQPVGDAQVMLEGPVVGDGSFRSKVVVTDAGGRFVVKTLPSRNDNAFTLSVVPPRGSRASAVRRQVTVKVANGVASMTPASVTLSDRLLVRGKVLKAGSQAGAGGVSVRASLQEATAAGAEPSPLKLEPVETVTLDDGTFELPMDSGLWRFEYYPGDMSPLASRLVNVKPVLDSKGEPLPTVELREVPLAFGRTVTGIVTANMPTRTGTPVPYSQLRFFRVTSVEGTPASILLGTAIADERGAYRVVLPSVSANASSQ